MSFGTREDAGAAAPAAARSLRAVPGSGRAPAVRVVADAAGFDALEEAWERLLARSEASVFQSFDWQRTWWRHFGERRAGARLHLVTVGDGEELAAIVPLQIERTHGLGLRRLLFVGHGDSDYLDALVAVGREAECAEAVADHLVEAAVLFDVAVLEETPERSRFGRLLHEALARRGWAAGRQVESPCPRVALARTWDETLARLSVAGRREVRRRLRNMQKEHAVELEVLPPGADAEPGMREFVEMHQARWARDGYAGVFADRAVADFHCDAARRLSRRGRLFLAFLRVDGERCAVNYGFAFGDSVSVYLTGSREVPPALARHSPGRTLHALCMQWAIARGSPVYDFMRGSEPYKYELGGVDVPNFTLVAYPRRPRLTAARHRVDRVVERAARRARREVHALRVARQDGGGWLSLSVRAHLGRAVRRVIADLRRIVGGRGREDAPAAGTAAPGAGGEAR